MRQLEMNLSDLEEAFENSFPEAFRYYLDRETGNVVMVTPERQEMLEELYADVYDDEGNVVQPLTEVIREQGLEHEAEELLTADQVEAGYGTRYVTIPRVESYEDYDDMEAFIDTVQDPRLRNELSYAIRGRGAFRRFKDVLEDHFHERERWSAFRDERIQQRIVDWLHGEGIEPILAPRPAPPSVRPQLLAAARTFVRAAREVPGVTRIALIGSLTTAEPSPKDVDLLVTVTPEADLSPLAALGRKLQADAQYGTGRGGEVFLADPAGSYLGRLCRWRECGPGLHRDCDAQHCGRRPYLHLDSARLTIPQFKVEIAVSLYAQDRLSLGKARELAGLSLWEFRQLLASRRIPAHYDESEMNRDVATLWEMGRLCSFVVLPV